MALDILNFDYETFSEADLTRVGSYNYARDPSTEVLMVAWRINGGRIRQWDYSQEEPAPRELKEALVDPDVQKWAWNAAFEMAITKYVWGLDVDLAQWRDTMVLGHYCSLPGQLEKAGPAVGLPEELCKNPNGKRLMKFFSSMNVSRKKANKGELIRNHWYHDLIKWDGYLEYNVDDVEAESQIRDILIPHDLPNWEWDYWHLDQEINQAGLPINMDMVENAIALYEFFFNRGLIEMQELTGLDNPNSLPQLLPWLKSQGYMFDDCKKGHIRQAFSYFEDRPDHWTEEQHAQYATNHALRDVLGLRLELSRTSIKKYYALRDGTSPDGNLRNVLQFMGASRTGRWSGRTFQPQNLPRPEKYLEKEIELHAANVQRLDPESFDLIYTNPFDVLASCIRPAAQAPKGQLFADADLNAIENRVLGWMANCKKILNVFEAGRDPYVDFATYLYHEPYDVLWQEYIDGDGSKRTIAKPGVLGCGYMLGPGKKYEDRQTGEIEATGLLGYAWNMGVRHFTPDQSKLSVDTFRSEFIEVKDYWYAIERAAIKCVREKRGTKAGVVSFDLNGDFLRMLLPSGRFLHYYKPRIEPVKMPWRDANDRPVWKDSLTYEGVDDRKQWKRMNTHPGKLTENGDQAISRDLLVHGMWIAKREYGLDIRLHVHDQNVALAADAEANEALEVLSAAMEVQPSWADGLPLGSAGFTSTVFKKD